MLKFLLRNSCLLLSFFPKAARMSYTACTTCSLSATNVHTLSMEAAGIVQRLEGKISQGNSPPGFFTGAMQGELSVRYSLCGCGGSRVM